jgi:hypothetical protein
VIKHNGTEIVAMDDGAGGFRRALANSPVIQAACDIFLRSRGIDPSEGMRQRIHKSAEASKARKAKR